MVRWELCFKPAGRPCPTSTIESSSPEAKQHFTRLLPVAASAAQKPLSLPSIVPSFAIHRHQIDLIVLTGRSGWSLTFDGSILQTSCASQSANLDNCLSWYWPWSCLMQLADALNDLDGVVPIPISAPPMREFPSEPLETSFIYIYYVSTWESARVWSVTRFFRFTRVCMSKYALRHFHYLSHPVVGIKKQRVSCHFPYFSWDWVTIYLWSHISVATFWSDVNTPVEQQSVIMFASVVKGRKKRRFVFNNLAYLYKKLPAIPFPLELFNWYCVAPSGSVRST